MSDVLQEFINLGLLDIEGDDSRLEKLRAAAADLAEQMKNIPRIAVYHTITVSTADPSPNDASFGEVAQHVEKHWNTYRNRFPEVPRQLFKAVSLQALSIVAPQEENGMKFAVGYTRRSNGTSESDTREGIVIRRVLEKFDSDLESHAANTWGIRLAGTHTISAGGNPKITKIEREKLASSIVAASGPANAQGQPIPASNPVWPSSNQGWTNEFGNRLAEAIASTVETTLLQVAGEIGKLNKSIVESANAALNDGRRQSWALEKQNSLLWWRKTLYSSRLGKSYRQLDPAEAVMMMTLDFQALLGGIAPISAEHLLKEAVADVCTGTIELTVSDLVKAAQSTIRPVLIERLQSSTQRAGLQPLAECLIRVASGSGVSVMENAVPYSVKPHAPSLAACRLLQEFQALDLTPLDRVTRQENK